MKEQVLIYEIKSSAQDNAEQLLDLNNNFFYWNDKFFKKLSIDDYVFVINKHAGYVLFTKLDKKGIPTQIKSDKTLFSDNGNDYKVRGIWDKFIRLKIILNLPTNNYWEWKSLGSSEITYINGDNIKIKSYENRIENINQLMDLSQNTEYQKVLKECLKNFEPKEPKTNGNVVKSIKDICNYINAKGFQYSYDEIANFYLCLRVKPFVILAGISGTGKTQLPRRFAEALGFSIEQVFQIPVRPDWTDSSDLLGYTSLDGKFIPKELTHAIIRANKNPDKPYFFILDEMNLARVEHYFSDFLSVIETREKKNGKIQTDPILKEELFNEAINKDEFPECGWPENLYLIGTVNMDETTHTFSRKVLDRANTIEMNKVDLNWPTINDQNIPALSGIKNDFFECDYLSSIDLKESDKEKISREMQILQKINNILEVADLHFAYRIRNEIAFYLLLNKKYNLLDETTAFDFQIVQKILPRIHGSSERVQTVLVEMLNLLEGKDFRSSGFDISMIDGKIGYEDLKYKRASKKIIFMLKRFNDDRFTSFWL